MLRLSACETLRAWLLSALVVHGAVAGNPDAKRLYDDLLSNYNKLVRPVVNTSDVLRVCIKLKLSQLIDVLSTKSALSSRSTRYGLEHRKFSEEKLGYTSGESLQKIISESDVSDMDTTRTYTLTKYTPNIFEIQSALMQNVNDVSRADSEAARIWNDSWKKSKLLLEALQSQKLNAKRVVELKKTKRKRSKLAHESEHYKIKNIETSDELRRVLEEFKMVEVEDLKRLYGNSQPQKKLVPAYFVLKVSQDSVADLQNLNGTIKNIKLVFANDEKDKKVKSEVADADNTRLDSLYRDVEPSLRVKDQILQTCSVLETGQVGNVQEEHAKVGSTSSCNFCERVQQDLKCQKEFNVSLLDQMKDVMQQLLTMTNLLRDIVLYKQSQEPIGSGQSREEIYVKQSDTSYEAMQNEETRPFVDSSSQTHEEEEDVVEDVVYKVSQNEFRVKDPEVHEIAKSFEGRASSAATSDTTKLNEPPYRGDYHLFPEQSRPLKKPNKVSFFKLCCGKQTDCDAMPPDEDYTNECMPENMSDEVTKCEENENISGDFRRDALDYWERRCSNGVNADAWNNYIDIKSSVHKSYSAHSNLYEPVRTDVDGISTENELTSNVQLHK